jgi:transmembrane sensor
LVINVLQSLNSVKQKLYKMVSLNKNILFEHFAGRTTPLQRIVISEWLQTAENQEVYYQWLEDYENTFPQILADKDVAKKVFFDKIYAENNPETVEIISEKAFDEYHEPIAIWKKSWFRWAIAAMLFLSFGMTFYLQKDNIFYKNYQTAYGETEAINLPDGSIVTLNANSILRLKRFGFVSAPIREVFLDGEAEFSVKHKSDNQRFIVKTSQKLEVEVLGTEFSVFARTRGSKVVLTKGKVKVNYGAGNQQHSIMMKPGDLVSLDKKGIVKLKEIQNVKVYTAWKSHRFIFDNTSLEEITYQIEETFGVHIQINSADLAIRTVTGTFSAEQADDLIAILQELLTLQYEKNSDGTVVLSEIIE